MPCLSRWLKHMSGHPLPLRLGVLAMASAVLGVGLDALARAGGGQNYVGGGGGFGGGGGDGDGIGALIYLAIAYPEVGVPLLIVVAVVYVVKRRMNPDNTTNRAVKRLEQVPMAMADLTPLRGRDPGFDEARFLERAKTVELRVQAAWSDRDMGPVRPFLSDGLFRRFATQLKLLEQQKIRNVTAGHRIIDIRIHGVETDEHFDTLHVLVQAAIRDVELDAALPEEKARAKAEKAQEEIFSEVWSFLRKPGAKTLEGGGMLEGQCPNCGAEVPAGESNRCEHCEALVNSGEYDWVLAEITQIEEWRPGSTGTVRGLAQMTERNPGFNRQAAEDRASYLFWRWIEAYAIGDPKPLAKVAAGGFKERVARMVQSGPANLYKVAVGAADLVACEVDVNGRDRFHVRVLWSSARSQKDAPAHQSNILSMGRKSGAVLDSDEGVSYARCPACHGPLGENDTPVCDYCGEALDAGEKDWVLEAVIQPEELKVQEPAAGADPAPVFLPDMGNLRERTILLMRMAAVVMADGVVTPAEMKLLKRAARRWEVSFEAVEPILAGQGGNDIAMTQTPANPEAFFSGLVSAALVDGRIDKKEERLLLDISRNLQMEEPRARQMMQKMAAEVRA